jgi:sec-independent protein translocase protein TatC
MAQTSSTPSPSDAPTNPERRAELGLEMPFGEHLEDLRRRLLFALLGIVPLFVLAIAVGQPIMRLLFEPVLKAQLASGNPAQLQNTGQFEYFGTYVKVSIILTVIVGLPWIFYQLWKFVSPGLYAHERRFAYTLLPMSVVLSAVGLVFMYKIMLPVVLMFFLRFNASVAGIDSPVVPDAIVAAAPGMPSFDGDPKDPKPGQMWFNRYLNQVRFAVAILPPSAAEALPKSQTDDAKVAQEPPAKDRTDHPPTAKQEASQVVQHDITIWSISATRGDQLLRQEFRVSEYIGTVFEFALGFAIAFQAPVVVLLLGWAGIINPALMSKYRRHAIMVCVVVGAILTPADPISIFLLAIPLYLLYELGLAMLRWLPASRVARGLRGSAGEDPDPEASGP